MVYVYIVLWFVCQGNIESTHQNTSTAPLVVKHSLGHSVCLSTILIINNNTSISLLLTTEPLPTSTETHHCIYLNNLLPSLSRWHMQNIFFLWADSLYLFGPCRGLFSRQSDIFRALWKKTSLKRLQTTYVNKRLVQHISDLLQQWL